MTRTTRCAALIPFAIAVALTVGCEDSPVTAPTDATIAVTASPTTVSIDPNRLVESPPGSGVFVPQTEGTTTISALLKDKDGLPLQGYSVAFTTAAGTLASYDAASGTSNPVETNASGVAQDVLTVATADPASIEVKALSGTISGTVTIAKTVATLNQPPVARVVISPATEQGVNQPVAFDGSTSTDPDNNPITVYRWTIYSTAGTVPDVVEATGANQIVRTYTSVQTLSGTLEITDDPAAPRQLQLGEPITYRSTAAFTYRIVAVTCGANAAPVAVIAGPASIGLSGAAAASVTATLDGTLSTDAEGPITAYAWTCGTAAVPVPVPGTNGAKVECAYTVQATAKTYQATLAVKDAGTGISNPDGSYPCQKVSPQVSVSVIVTPTAPAER